MRAIINFFLSFDESGRGHPGGNERSRLQHVGVKKRAGREEERETGVWE